MKNRKKYIQWKKANPGGSYYRFLYETKTKEYECIIKKGPSFKTIFSTDNKPLACIVAKYFYKLTSIPCKVWQEKLTKWHQ